MVLKQEDGLSHVLYSKLDAHGPAKNKAHLPDLLEVIEMIKAKIGPTAREEKEKHGTKRKTADSSKDGDEAGEEKDEKEEETPAALKPKRFAKRARGKKPSTTN